MRRLGGNDKNMDRVIHKIFMDELPLSVRRILVTHSNRNLDELAATADRVVTEDRRQLLCLTAPATTQHQAACVINSCHPSMTNSTS